MVDETFWAWFAGFIDGDGHLTLAKHKNKRYHLGYQWVPKLYITNIDSHVMEIISLNIGIGHIAFLGKNNEYRQYRLESKQVRDILPKIIPYLKIKKQEAIILLQATNIINDTPYKGCRISQEKDTKLREISEAMLEIRLNRKQKGGLRNNDRA